MSIEKRLTDEEVRSLIKSINHWEALEEGYVGYIHTDKKSPVEVRLICEKTEIPGEYWCSDSFDRNYTPGYTLRTYYAEIFRTNFILGYLSGKEVESLYKKVKEDLFNDSIKSVRKLLKK